MTSQELKDLIEKAGLGLGDVAKIFGISRSKLYQWLDFDKPPKSPVLMDHIRRQVAFIKRGVDTGMLPTKHVEKEFRFQSVSNILRHIETT